MFEHMLISVIVPIYNISRYVEECIESILVQTYRKIEILIVDDGSTDGSEKICDTYIEKDSRIKVYHKKNGGLSSARNYGIERAKGDYFIFVDGDDTIKSSLCEELCNAVLSYDSDIGVCRSYKNEYETNFFNGSIIKYSIEEALEEMFREKSFNVSAWGKIFKKELFCNIRFPEGYLYEDLATTYKLFDRAKSVVMVDKALYYYRARSGSIMNSKFNNRKEVFIDISEEIIEYVSEKYPRVILSVRNRTVRYCISFVKEIAMAESDYYRYALRLKCFIKHNLWQYLKSDYKLSSKLFGVMIAFNLRMSLYSYKKLYGKMIYEKNTDIL